MVATFNADSGARGYSHWNAADVDLSLFGKFARTISNTSLPLSSFVAKRNLAAEGCIPGPLRLDGDYIPPFVEIYRFILCKLALFARPISHMSISGFIYSGGE